MVAHNAPVHHGSLEVARRISRRTDQPAGSLHSAIQRIWREEGGRVIARLARALGDIDLAERAVSEAMVAALANWPTSGVPDNPAAWLLDTARRKALDAMKARTRGWTRLVQVSSDPTLAPTTMAPSVVDTENFL